MFEVVGVKSKIGMFADTSATLRDLMRASRARHHRGVRVEWPDDLRTIEDALRELPKSPDWPGLFEVLLEPRGPEKRVGIVLDRDGPMGVALLRSIGRSSWETATRWIVPGFLFPVRPGCTYAVLKALQVRVDVGWWRYPEPPPSGPGVQNFEQKERYQLSCTDFEVYWKQSGHLHTVRQAQRRCKNFVLKINPEGGAEWTIRNWEQKWRSDPKTPGPHLEDRVAAAKFLERLGRHHTLVLFDGDTPIAGNTHLVHKDCVVDQVKYRVPEYHHYGVGTYLVEAMFQWAARLGYREVDMGTGHTYKSRWAPTAGGYTYWLTVPPEGKYEAVKEAVKEIKGRLATSLSGWTSRFFCSNRGNRKETNVTGVVNSSEVGSQ